MLTKQELDCTLCDAPGSALRASSTDLLSVRLAMCCRWVWACMSSGSNMELNTVTVYVHRLGRRSWTSDSRLLEALPGTAFS